MAERRLHGLQRVLGVNALFSTAYGNVGSSIYYALGLVATFALGLTPVVFIITGFIFYLTAATYAEATAMYPEAGGSSSFARRAFNEFWSFFAAWAQMLNYMITIAISAFFVPHYFGSVIGVDALRHSPADIFFGIGVVVVLSLVNVVGRQGVGRRQRRCWPWSTSSPSCCSCWSASCSSSRPTRWSTTSTSASRRRGRTSSSRSRWG